MSIPDTPLPAARIFVSHSHHDDDVGKRLVGDLRARLGRDAVWYDSAGGLRVGQDWWRTIVGELSARNIFIVILSPDAVASPWVQQEMVMAFIQRVRRNKILLPLAYRDCTVPEDWDTIQTFPLSDPAVDPDAYGSQLATLFDEIERTLSKMPPYVIEPTVVPPVPQQAPGSRQTGAERPPPSWMVKPEWEKREYAGSSMRFRFLNVAIRNARMLLCSIFMIAYWLLIGYAMPAIFPYPILWLSGSPYLVYWLQGESGKTQLLKALVVFASLTTDWLVAGVVLTRVVHVSIFPPLPLGPANTLGLVGVLVFFLLLFVYLWLWIREWRYLNVINLRKILLVSMVTTLLMFASQIQYFGTAFLYFPILAMVVSLLFFLYNVIGLGGSSYSEWGAGYNANLEKILQNQLRDSALAKAYFERRASGGAEQ